MNERERERERESSDKELPNVYLQILSYPIGVTYRFRIVAIYVNGDNRHGPSSARITVGSSSSTSSNVDAAGMVSGRIEPSIRGPTIVEIRALSENELFVGWQVSL